MQMPGDRMVIISAKRMREKKVEMYDAFGMGGVYCPAGVICAFAIVRIMILALKAQRTHAVDSYRIRMSPSAPVDRDKSEHRRGLNDSCCRGLA